MWPENVTKSSLLLFVFAIVLALIPATASAQVAPTPKSNIETFTTNGSPKNIRPGHVLVRFRETPSQNVLEQLHADGANIIGKIPEIGVTHLQAAPQAALALIENLRKRSDVEFAEFDSVVEAFEQPNDPYYATPYATFKYGTISQWGPQAVSAPAAWDLTMGDQSIVIAIVDTGVDNTHPDLASKIVGMYSYVKGSTGKDGFGHGTHCAGIAAAATNNDVGIAGMCPNCSILSVQVLDDQGSGYLSDVASGITYAASHGARVISLSLGGSSHSDTMRSALAYAVANNALPVCAAGNSNSSIAPEPAYWYDCLSVIATDQTGAKASFSNYGIADDVAAPGVAILSTMPTYPVTLNNYGYLKNYDALSGTSMATPAVAGIAGLVLSQNPNLTPIQVKGIIEATAGDGASWTQNVAFGVVNAAKAVSLATHSDYTPPVANLVFPTDGTTISGVVSIQAAPSDDSGVHHLDIVQNGARFLAPLVGVSFSSGKGKNSSTTPAWTIYWPSTAVFNGTVGWSVLASDIYGNLSPAQNLSFTVQNRLVSQSWTQHLCYPSTASCPSQVWLPVTTGVATEAATHLQGTVSFSKKDRSAIVWLWVARPGFSYFCGSFGAVDCYPSLILAPDSGRNSYTNYSGSQITTSGAAMEADVQWTLTYPQ